jgi:hypothetical protein
VTVNDQDTPPIRGCVDEMFGDRNVAVVAAEAGEEFVMISRDVNDARAFAGLTQEFLDDVVVLLRPIDSAPHLPGIDQVADDIERLEIVIAEEFEDRTGVTVARPEVDVGDPGRAQVAERRRPDDTKVSSAGGWIERWHLSL